MSFEFRLWSRNACGQLAAQTVSAPLWLTGGSSIPHSSRLENAVGVWPIEPRRDAIGAALVPDQLDRAVLINGVPLRPGLHGLQQADRLEFDGSAYWFAARRTVETSTYDPAIHGSDVFCELTKARLEAGEAIVVCPGAPRRACRAIFRLPAWELAMSSETMRRCACCGFQPGESEWIPALPQPQRTFDEFLNAIAARRT